MTSSRGWGRATRPTTRARSTSPPGTRRSWPRPNARKWSVTVTHTRATCSGAPPGGLIDPDGFIGERAYDLGVALRDACRELAATELAQPGTALLTLRRECHRLASLADIDPARVWQWAFVERVTTGLHLAWHGHTEESATFLDTATLLAG